MEEDLPVCKFGADCYRKNPDHRLKFAHPAKPDFPDPEKSSEAEPNTSCGSGTGNPIVVILVGVPGSGKSRFCQAVIENAAQSWTRVCQDVIANGKRGTKAQCIRELSNSLSSSRSVFVDRTNVSREQRLEFLEFARKSGVEAHGVVLNLPPGTCITRAMNRTSHEGGLEGNKVGGVIMKMAKSLELPTLEEGFSRITVCRSDSEVEGAIEVYKTLGPSSKLEPGVFDSGAKEIANVNTSKQTTTKGSLHQFFKPVQKPGAGPGTSSPVAQKPEQTSGDSREVKASEGILKTLAFPSISTADFRFDHERAARIIVESVSDFLQREESSSLRLVMVDIEPHSDMLTRVRSLAQSSGVDPQRFLTIPGDITRLRSTGGPECLAIANAANWRLKGGGGGVNLAIYRAAGAGFEEATKRCASTLDVGKALAVQLPSGSPLRKEGVTHVIHVLGPNMNPQRPNCLGDDYTEGSRLLRAAYSALFLAFASVVKGSSPGRVQAPANPGRVEAPASSSGGSHDAFAVLMKRKNGDDEKAGGGLKRGKADVFADDDGRSVTENEAGDRSVSTTTKAKHWPGWAQALYDTAFHPEKHREVILELNDEAVVLPDLYAKAKKHLLVVSRVKGLDSIADVRKEHLPLLREMHSIGERWARKMMQEDSSLVFRLGYHWVPSMRQLHLHVVSQDFDSPGLKNKKHWNSFTTAYFRDSRDVIAELESTGALELCSEEMEMKLLDSELRCHRCRAVQPSIPRLKAHLGSCNKPLQCLQATVSPGP